jgi:Flp pilus assembly protein TadD
VDDEVMAQRNYCLVDQEFKNDGSGEMVFVALVRQRGEKPQEIGGFLIDLGCLGVKDAFYTQVIGSELEKFKEDAFREGCREESAAWGRKLIEDAIAYAKSLGFKAHPDYKKAARVLGGVRASDCDAVFHFGRDGKPFYVQGQHSDDTARRIVDHLERRLGADGFVFVVLTQTALSASVDDRVEYFLEAFRKGLKRKAIEGIQKLLETYPDEACVHFAQGVLQMKREEYADALESFNRAIEIQPKFETAWMNKAVAHERLNQMYDMIKAFQKAVELTSPDDEVHQKAKKRLKDVSHFLRLYYGLSISEYLEVETLYLQAFAAFEAKNFHEAIQIINDIQDQFSTNERTLTLLGNCYRGLGEIDRAREAIERALEIDPEHQTALTSLRLLEADEMGMDFETLISEALKKIKKKAAKSD